MLSTVTTKANDNRTNTALVTSGVVGAAGMIKEKSKEKNEVR